MPGADLYGYFMGGGDHLLALRRSPHDRHNLHPNDSGVAGMNAEWSEAMLSVYPR